MRTHRVAFISTVALLATGACHRSPSALSASFIPDSARMAADVRYLASDALEGRASGTKGNDSARVFKKCRRPLSPYMIVIVST